MKEFFLMLIYQKRVILWYGICVGDLTAEFSKQFIVTNLKKVVIVGIKMGREDIWSFRNCVVAITVIDRSLKQVA